MGRGRSTRSPWSEMLLTKPLTGVFWLGLSSPGLHPWAELYPIPTLGSELGPPACLLAHITLPHPAPLVSFLPMLIELNIPPGRALRPQAKGRHVHFRLPRPTLTLAFHPQSHLAIPQQVPCSPTQQGGDCGIHSSPSSPSLPRQPRVDVSYPAFNPSFFLSLVSSFSLSALYTHVTVHSLCTSFLPSVPFSIFLYC